MSQQQPCIFWDGLLSFKGSFLELQALGGDAMWEGRANGEEVRGLLPHSEA